MIGIIVLISGIVLYVYMCWALATGFLSAGEDSILREDNSSRAVLTFLIAMMLLVAVVAVVTAVTAILQFGMEIDAFLIQLLERSHEWR